MNMIVNEMNQFEISKLKVNLKLIQLIFNPIHHV